MFIEFRRHRINIEILFCVKYCTTCNISQVGLLLRQTRINKHFYNNEYHSMYIYKAIFQETKHNVQNMGAQWLSGRVLDLRSRGRGFEPHQRHCVVVLEQDTFILA